MPKRLMILGARDEQVPLIEAAKRRGFPTLVVDGSAEAPGARLADVFVTCDVEDIDGCVRLAREHAIEAVTTAVLSLGMRTVGAVAEALNLPGLRARSALHVTDKIRMRERLLEAGVMTTEHRGVRDLAQTMAACEELGPPVVVKPSDGSGSRGVRVVRRRSDIAEAFEAAAEATRSGLERAPVTVERFVEGSEYGVNGFVIDRVARVLCARAKLVTEEPYRQELGYSYPSLSSDEELANLGRYLSQVARALELDGVPFVADVIRTFNGSYVLIEMGARLPGYGLSYSFVPHATGVDVYDATLDLACGLRPLFEVRPRPTAMVFIQPKAGRLSSTAEIPRISSDDLVQLRSELAPGDEVRPIIDGVVGMKNGFVVASGSDAAQALENARQLMQQFCSRLVYATP